MEYRRITHSMERRLCWIRGRRFGADGLDPSRTRLRGLVNQFA